MSDKMISIPEERLKELLVAEMTLEALEAGGVDNWEWCGESIHDYLEFLRTESFSKEVIDEYMKKNDVECLCDLEFEDFAQIEVDGYK